MKIQLPNEFSDETPDGTCKAMESNGDEQMGAEVNRRDEKGKVWDNETQIDKEMRAQNPNYVLITFCCFMSTNQIPFLFPFFHPPFQIR